jgi:cell wall-associated NlpC family hydrolase
MALAAWAAPYVGLPYRPNGRTRAGLDCYGLVALVLEEVFGLRVPSYAGCYEDPEDWPSIRAAVLHGLVHWERVAAADALPGDGAVLRLRGQPLHVGLVVDTAPLTVLHILAGLDACCQRLDNPMWGPRLIGLYRWRRRP